jgi:hypothetical protein
MFDIQLFGRLEVRARGECLTGDDLGGVRPRHVLELLALRGEMSISELADVLRTSVRSVETALAVLRQHLEPGVPVRESVIVAHRHHVTLDPDRVRVDVSRFDELIAAAAGRPAERAVKPLTAATFLAGRPLLEDEDAPWAAEARAQYRAKLVMARPRTAAPAS